MGRILGLDYGRKRVGAALGDPATAFATPLEVYQRRTRPLDADHYRKLVDDYNVERLVVGLPISGLGHEGMMGSEARAWGRWLAAAVGLRVTFFDERYTSVMADEAMRDRGLKSSQRKPRIDMMAAQLLLQQYFDAGCPEGPAAEGGAL